MNNKQNKLTDNNIIILRNEREIRKLRNERLLEDYAGKIYELPEHSYRTYNHEIKFGSDSNRIIKSISKVTFATSIHPRCKVELGIETGYLLTDDNIQYVLYERFTDKTENQTKVINVTRCDSNNDYAFVYEDIATRVPKEKQKEYLDAYSEIIDENYDYDLKEQLNCGYYIEAQSSELFTDYADMEIARDNKIQSKYNNECKKLVKTRINKF